MALFAALIFVVHPVQTQAVTYTIQRIAAMAAMFFLASTLFYVRARVLQQWSSVVGGGKSEAGGKQGASFSGTSLLCIVRSVCCSGVSEQAERGLSAVDDSGSGVHAF